MNNYTTILRERNLKATPQRLEIANVLFSSGHLSVEALYESLLKKFNSISLATIYKNINLMLEASFISEVKLPNAKTVYELAKETHSHLVCSSCSSVRDVVIDLSEVTKSASISLDFNILKTDLVLSGLCKDCD